MPQFLTPLDFEKERAAILEDIKTQIDDVEFTLSDDYNILISCILYRLGLKIDEINYIIAQNYLEYSSGVYLDELVALLGLTRSKGSLPQAKIKIKCKDSTFLSKGTKLKSSDGASAYVLMDYALAAGENEVIVQGDKEGQWQTTILEIKNPLIEEVSMLSKFVIYEPSEDDSSLRTRFKNALASFSTAGSEESYTHYAKVSGVGKVKAFSPEKGVVKIVYFGENEGASELIKDNLAGNVPLTDKIIIQKIESTKINLDITLTLEKEANFSLLQEGIAKNISDFFAQVQIGEEVSHNKIISLCFIDDNILDAQVSAFKAIAQDSIYELESIHISKASV